MQEVVRAARRSLGLKDTDVIVPAELADILAWIEENQGRTETQLTRPIPGQDGKEWWCGCLPSAPVVRFSTIRHLMDVVMTPEVFKAYNLSGIETLEFLINPVCDHKAIDEAIKCRKEGRELFKRSRALTKQSGAPYHAIRILKQEGKL